MQRKHPALCAVVSLLVLTLIADSTFAGVGSKNSMYVGGTVAAIPANAEAPLDLSNDTLMTFQWKGGQWQVPYTAVSSLEYGQHAGRRVGLAVAGVATFGIAALPALFSKKRRHYLTIGYMDTDGKQQAAIFEVGKDAIKTSLTVLEVRTGKKVEFEDEGSPEDRN